MSDPSADVSVVICSYTEERWDALVEAVRSVQSQRVPARDVVLVVDHNPRLLLRAQEHLAGLTVIENLGPRGESGARNSGAAAARGSIVAFLDDDAVAEPDWLEQLTRHYGDPRVRGVGGSIQPLWLSRRPGWFPEEFNWVVGCTYRGLPESTAPVRNLIGANMSFRRDAFLALGGLPTQGGLGRVGKNPVACAETELCIRMLRRWPASVLLYEPRAQVRHRVPAARAGWRYFRSRCYAEGVSKARVTRLVGTERSLASERAYVIRTLPKGVARGLGDFLRWGRPGDLASAGAIVGGLALTTVGYLAGSVARS